MGQIDPLEHKGSRDWTAVRTCLGLFQYTRRAQGLFNSGAMFQQVVNGVLGGYAW
jgi:hypothetical protein